MSASISVVPSKSDIPSVLHRLIIESCREAIQDHGFFTIALSGGSVPSFLRGLTESFQQAQVDPHFSKWHVCLADERIVPLDDADSNYKAIVDVFDQDPSITIPADQIYSINEALLLSGDTDDDDTTQVDAAVAKDYQERVIVPLLNKSSSSSKKANASALGLTKRLDCIVLGFGPDGHTCSLFPGHALLDEKDQCVAYLQDSPKPPPRRITLTYPVLNNGKRIIVCGSGSGKKDIVSECFSSGSIQHQGTSCSENYNEKETLYPNVQLTSPPPFPITRVHATT
jgi:6-phosphogluconolactonase